MTTAEQLFTILANARTKAGNVLTKEQWLGAAQPFLDGLARAPEAAKAKRKARRNSAPPPEPIPDAVYTEPDGKLWREIAIRLWPDTQLSEWIKNDMRDWFSLPLLVRKGIVEEIAKQPPEI